MDIKEDLTIVEIRIKSLRQQFNYTQNEIAKLMHVSRSLICLWEQGYANISLKQIIKLASVYKVPLDYILGIIDNIDLIVSNIVNERRDIALPYIELEDKNVTIDQIACFKKAKMVDKMSNKIYNFLLLKGDNLDFDKDDNVINIYKKDIHYDIKKDKIVINIKGMGKVKKVNPDISLEESKSYKMIEEQINEAIYEEVMEFLKNSLEKESDLVGFKDLYYKFFQKEKDNVPYEVNVDIKISRNGAIYETIHD